MLDGSDGREESEPPMSDMQSKINDADLIAGNAFRDSVLDRADAHNGPYPLWHGWVIVSAFQAGAEHARKGHAAAELAGEVEAKIQSMRDLIVSLQSDLWQMDDLPLSHAGSRAGMLQRIDEFLESTR